MNSEYEQELSHFTIEVSCYELEVWKGTLLTGKSLPGEVVGYLLGKAAPVFRDVVCELCKEKIKKGELRKSGKGDFGWRWNNTHEACYQSELEKRKVVNNV